MAERSQNKGILIERRKPSFKLLTLFVGSGSLEALGLTPEPTTTLLKKNGDIFLYQGDAKVDETHWFTGGVPVVVFDTRMHHSWYLGGVEEQLTEEDQQRLAQAELTANKIIIPERQISPYSLPFITADLIKHKNIL